MPLARGRTFDGNFLRPALLRRLTSGAWLEEPSSPDLRRLGRHTWLMWTVDLLGVFMICLVCLASASPLPLLPQRSSQEDAALRLLELGRLIAAWLVIASVSLLCAAAFDRMFGSSRPVGAAIR